MFKFRNANAQDIQDLNVLVSRAYRGDISRQGWTTEAHLLGGQRTDPEMLAEMIAEKQSVIRLAYAAEGEHLVGCVYLKFADKKCYLGMLSVDPTQQNSGCGRSLLADAESWAHRQGAHAIWMTVIHTRTELIAWYERRGYVRTGKYKEFPHEDERYGVAQVSSEDLRLEILEKKLS